MPITYLKGDATYPQGEGSRIIAQICNDAGGWGRGFVVAVSKRWKEPEAAYRAWFRGPAPPANPTKGKILMTTGPFELGRVQLVQVEPNIFVLNMIAQKGYGRNASNPHRTEEDDGGKPPIRYDALEKCLEAGGVLADTLKGAFGILSFAMPRIGCSLAGGSWSSVEPIINQMLGDRQVFVYDFLGSLYNP
jgi:O-acetyl-ADP-ribose deacetylase (regulator of RNase III)